MLVRFHFPQVSGWKMFEATTWHIGSSYAANSFFDTSENSSPLRVHPDSKAPGHLVKGFASVHCDSMNINK